MQTEDPKAQKSRAGLSRVLHATGYSMQGFRVALREPAFLQEFVLCCAMIPLAFILGQTAVERALLIGVCAIVLITELLNTGIERVVDLVTSDWHPLAKQAKDLGSAAVFVSLTLAVVTWGMIAWVRFA